MTPIDNGRRDTIQIDLETRNFQVEYNSIDKNIVNSIPALSHQYSSQEIEVMFSTVISDPSNTRPQVNQSVNYNLTSNQSVIDVQTQRSHEISSLEQPDHNEINNGISSEELSARKKNCFLNNISNQNNPNLSGRANRYAKRNNENKESNDKDGSFLKNKRENSNKKN
jgi:hypothetical protein